MNEKRTESRCTTKTEKVYTAINSPPLSSICSPGVSSEPSLLWLTLKKVYSIPFLAIAILVFSSTVLTTFLTSAVACGVDDTLAYRRKDDGEHGDGVEEADTDCSNGVAAAEVFLSSVPLAASFAVVVADTGERHNVAVAAEVAVAVDVLMVVDRVCCYCYLLMMPWSKKKA